MADLDPRLQELIDRQAIWQVMLNYCRGIDRLDRSLMRSAYHDDAIDDHGIVVLGADDFVDWALGWHSQNLTSHHHGLSNHFCDIDGDVAHCETYYHFFGVNKAGPHTVAMGRYIDRVERRAGVWRIAARVCVSEMVGDLAASQLPPEYVAALTSSGPATRGPDDVSWTRPLVTRLPPRPTM